MKKSTFILLLLLGLFVKSQEKINSNKLDFFASLDANIGFDVKQIIKRNQAVTDEQKMQVNPGKFLGGFSALANFHPLNRWAFGQVLGMLIWSQIFTWYTV